MTPVAELPALLDVLKLACAVHVTAETNVFAALLDTMHGPDRLRDVVAQTRAEHARQQDILDRLSLSRPGSDAWYAQALELRALVKDHAARAELARSTVQDHVPQPLHGTLAREYAIERMQVLARTSPIALAKAQLAAPVAAG